MNGLSTRQAAAVITQQYAPFGSSVLEWQVRRVFELGLLPDPPRFAGKRVIDPAAIPRIVEAIRHRGWLPKQEPAK